MAIPNYQSVMLPLLKLCADGEEHSQQEAYAKLADEMGLTDEERTELLPSGLQSVFSNRIGWARSHMKIAKLIEYTGRGVFRITPRGQELLKEGRAKIDRHYLLTIPEYGEHMANLQARTGRKAITSDVAVQTEDDQTPEEMIETAYQKIRDELATQILDEIAGCSPNFFERLVVDLLLRMGYGGNRKEAGVALQTVKDEGVDGFINQDKLGLEVIYVQAKRWRDASVGRKEIQSFAGALQGKKANKGVFITTSAFSAEARDFVSKVGTKIVLVDGERLADLMIDHDLGVSTTASYHIKRIDSDYFVEE